MKEELFPQQSSICYLCTVFMWKQKIKAVLLTKHRSEISVIFTRSDELEDMEGRLASCCVLCQNTKEVTKHTLPLCSLCTGPVKTICSTHEGKQAKAEYCCWHMEKRWEEKELHDHSRVQIPRFDLTLHLLESSERQQFPQIRNSC